MTVGTLRGWLLKISLNHKVHSPTQSILEAQPPVKWKKVFFMVLLFFLSFFQDKESLRHSFNWLKGALRYIDVNKWQTAILYWKYVGLNVIHLTHQTIHLNKTSESYSILSSEHVLVKHVLVTYSFFFCWLSLLLI